MTSFATCCLLNPPLAIQFIALQRSGVSPPRLPLASQQRSPFFFGGAKPGRRVYAQSTAVLLDRTPRLLSEGKLADALVWISNLEGVIGCRDVHMWSHTGAGAMGSLHVVVV